MPLGFFQKTEKAILFFLLEEVHTQIARASAAPCNPIAELCSGRKRAAKPKAKAWFWVGGLDGTWRPNGPGGDQNISGGGPWCDHKGAFQGVRSLVCTNPRLMLGFPFFPRFELKTENGPHAGPPKSTYRPAALPLQRNMGVPVPFTFSDSGMIFLTGYFQPLSYLKKNVFPTTP